MTVYAFVGPSGSGKSYRATWVAQQNNIDYIIDDGLFIYKNKLLAGFSAKKESTRVGSIRRAIFKDKAHVAIVKEAIAAHRPESILILGTSDGMVQEIARTLGLPEIEQYIRIEDIATQEEMDKARHIRVTQGEHVIPVPTFEIKQDFSGYFLKALNIFNKSKRSNDVFRTIKSVVRPTFSYRGEYHISNHVLITICQHEAMKVRGVARVARCDVEAFPTGAYINIDIAVWFGAELSSIGKQVQQNVYNAIEAYTAINVCEVNVCVKGIAM